MVMSAAEVTDRWLRGTVLVATAGGPSGTIGADNHPWVLDEPDDVCLEAAEWACDIGAKESIARMRSDCHHPAGVLYTEEDEPVLAVKLKDHCPHGSGAWAEPDACGHVFCKMCDGYVDPVSLVVLKGPGPIVKCNRRPKPLSSYKFFFKEHVCFR